jgi:hypothetical protein
MKPGLKRFTVGGVEISEDDTALLRNAPEMLQVLFATAAMLYADGPLYVAKLQEAGAWTKAEKAQYLALMKQTVHLLMKASGGKLFPQPKGGVQ